MMVAATLLAILRTKEQTNKHGDFTTNNSLTAAIRTTTPLGLTPYRKYE